jgi:transcriptional regulator with XRE-family HTH domain
VILLNNRIKNLRTELGLNISELAKKLKVNTSTILRYENGQINPPPEKLKILSEIFDCSIDYLLYLSESRKNELKILVDTNPKTKEIFINRLKDLIINKNLTKNMISINLNLDKQLLDDFINGDKIPSIDILKSLANYLDTTIDYLVGLNDNPSKYEIVILEDEVEIKEGFENKKVSAKVIRDFLKSVSDDF